GGVTYKWGVTNLLLEPGSAPPPVDSEPVDFELTLGVMETGDYGNRFNDALDPDGMVHGSFVIDGAPEDLVLSFDGFDIDDAEEMRVLVNGVNLGTVAAGVNEGLAPYALFLSADLLQTGLNSITFEKLGGVTYKWGVTNLLLEPGSAPPPVDSRAIATYDTTLWSADDPSGYGSGDPSGIAYIPELDLLFIADSEHNESPYFSSINLFAVRTDGTYVDAFSLRAFTDEPTGLGYNPLDGLLYISDDDQRAVFIVNPLDPTTLLGTIDLSSLGIGDAEDPVFDPLTGNMYILDGADRTLYELTVAGDLVSSFGLPSVITDAEGLAYDSQSQTFLVSSGKTHGAIFQIDKSGTLLASTTFLNDDINPKSGILPALKGLDLAPSSDPNDGDTLSLYAVDYGVDQVADGRMYELNINDIVSLV
ncbi:SdiA-regulated domain-containing protein, partial [Limibaculum sp. FT325]|uniref:SdiA-regulated domain-containing protein n=1 Tax=Thermohalobaculum sediminis TaxID=2939436 RepID=UPI0020C13E2C